MTQVATAHGIDGRTHRVFGTRSYAAQTWDRARRVIVKAEHLAGPNGGKANPRFVVTNVASDARTLYENVYCQRGDTENRIKEQHLGLFADRTSWHRFVANPFRVLLGAAAYALVDQIRRTALAGTEMSRAQVSTIRLRLFRVGALVVTSARRVVVRLAGGYPWADVFRHVAGRWGVRVRTWTRGDGGPSGVPTASRCGGLGERRPFPRGSPGSERIGRIRLQSDDSRPLDEISGLTVRRMTRRDVYEEVRRRAADAGIGTAISCHTFRATGITNYLTNGGTLEKAQQLANHEYARTIKLYDRRNDRLSLVGHLPRPLP